MWFITMLSNKRGSTFVYVIILMALLAVAATGFLYIIRFHMSTTTNHFHRLQQTYLAKSIHRTVCQQAAAGELEILQEIVADVMAKNRVLSKDESSYYATTGEQPLVLGSGESLLVRLDIMCEFEGEEEAGMARLDTYVKFDEGDAYQMSALLSLEGGRGELSEYSQWVVTRHYQTDEGESWEETVDLH